MKQLLALIIILIIMFESPSCKKADSGVNTTLDSNSQMPNNFLSTKVGTWWEYGSRGDSDAHNYTRYATGKDSSKMGFKLSYYRRHDHVLNYNNSEYFGIFDNNLMTLIDLNGQETTYLPYVFYKRGAKVNDTWNNTGNVSTQGLNFSTKIVSKLVESGQTLSWNNLTFKDVYHVKSDIYVGALQAHGGTLELYFNDGFGVVKGVANINILSGAFQKFYTDSLVVYHIEP